MTRPTVYSAVARSSALWIFSWKPRD